MKCGNGHEVVFGLLHCQECGRRVGAANLPASQVRQTMPGDHASGSVDDRRHHPVVRRRSIWKRSAVAVVILGLIGGTVAALVIRRGPASSVATQEPAEQARVGDCITTLPHIENPSAPVKDQKIDHVTVISCARPHMAEAFAQFNLAQQLGVGYPGYDKVENAVDADCQRALRQRRPVSGVAVTSLRWTASTPGDPDIWAVDPEVMCYAYRSDKALVSRLLQPGHAAGS